MNTRLRSVMATSLVALAALGSLTACSGGNKKVSQTVTPGPTSTVSTTPAKPTTKPRPTRKPPAVNPLTGGRPTTGPVIAVKIDDTGPGRPQLNIDQANVVYIEEVEGGLDRLIGLFYTRKPTVGYVRSIRLSDPELLLQYGRITLAASGGSNPSLQTLAASKLPSWINDRHAAFFRRVPHPGDHGYINLTLNLAKVAATVKTAGARNVGFVWKANPAGLASLPRATTIKTTVGRQLVEFVYDAKTRLYTRVINGVKQKAADGRYITTQNLIIQACKVTNSTHLDINHDPQQFTHSIGTGAVHVFRNGRMYTGTWSRGSVSAPTVFRDAKGAQITLMPGGVWIALVRPTAPINAH